MPTLKSINAKADTNFRRTKELVETLKNPPAEEAAPAGFTITCRDGAIIIDGPYDPEKFYRLAVLSDGGNPIQDVNPEWGGWPFVWSAENFPDNPPPPAPLFWTFSEENYISRRWRNRLQYPADYRRRTWEGVSK